MITFHTRVETAERIDGQLVLAYEQREKCRLRTRTAAGEEVAVFTVRGSVLRDGDLLKGEDGRVLQVVAAIEPTYVVRCRGLLGLTRCAFHLGNHHTQTQIGADFLRIRIDPVLGTMLEGLGASVTEENAAFEPEAGAYGGGHRHGDEHNLLAPVPLRQRIHRPGDPP